MKKSMLLLVLFVGCSMAVQAKPSKSKKTEQTKSANIQSIAVNTALVTSFVAWSGFFIKSACFTEAEKKEKSFKPLAVSTVFFLGSLLAKLFTTKKDKSAEYEKRIAALEEQLALALPSENN